MQLLLGSLGTDTCCEGSWLREEVWWLTLRRPCVGRSVNSPAERHLRAMATKVQDMLESQSCTSQRSPVTEQWHLVTMETRIAQMMLEHIPTYEIHKIEWSSLFFIPKLRVVYCMGRVAAAVLTRRHWMRGKWWKPTAERRIPGVNLVLATDALSDLISVSIEKNKMINTAFKMNLNVLNDWQESRNFFFWGAQIEREPRKGK